MPRQLWVSEIGAAYPAPSLEALVDADLDILVTALQVKIDDMLIRDSRPGHPVRLSQAEPVCLAGAQALLDVDPQLTAARSRLILITGKSLAGCQAQADLTARVSASGPRGRYERRNASENRR